MTHCSFVKKLRPGRPRILPTATITRPSSSTVQVPQRGKQIKKDDGLWRVYFPEQQQQQQQQQQQR
jgi:hypothetical protein